MPSSSAPSPNSATATLLVFLCLSAKPPPTESPIEPPTIAEVDWKPSDASVMCQVPPLPPHSPPARPRISASAFPGSTPRAIMWPWLRCVV